MGEPKRRCRQTTAPRARAQQQSFAAARKLFSQSPSQAGNRPAEITKGASSCDFPLSMWRCRRSSTIPAGRSNGATLSRRRPMTPIIIGAGGHGLATAYYLAKEHGLTNVAVLEKGWLGGGNTGRNTTIIRSNYLWEESAALYEHALKLWEGLSQELNYNVMYSPRGVMMLAHNTHDVQVGKRHVHANRLAGVDNEWLTPEEAKAFCPILNIARDVRYPVDRRGAPAPRRHSAARRGRLGLCAGRVGARNRHHPELRGDGDPPRRLRRRLRRRDDAWRDRDQEDRRRRRRAYVGGDGDGRRPHAARELSAAGFGVRAGQADDALRRDVEHDPRLHVAIRQGRTRHRRRHRRLHVLFADRRPAHRQSHAGGDLRTVPRRCVACACCATGAASST